MTQLTVKPDLFSNRTQLIRPTVSQSADIHRLVSECKPLDLNSVYAYLLLCEHFADTCVLAENNSRAVGFVSAYKPPSQRQVMFVWQVAVTARMRGSGLAKAMLRELLGRDALRSCRYLETTISPSNTPSRRLFYSLAHELDAPVTEKAMFVEQDFGKDHHEQETLIRIGPLAGK